MLYPVKLPKHKQGLALRGIKFEMSYQSHFRDF